MPFFLILVVHSLLVILVIRGEYLTPEDLTDLRGFEIEYGVQLPCGLFICQRDYTEIILFCKILVILVIRGVFIPGGSHGFSRICPCDTRDPWRFASGVSLVSAQIVLV